MRSKAEAAWAKGAKYAERFRDGVSAEALRAEAGVAGATMAEILRAHGCDLRAQRTANVVSFARPYGTGKRGANAPKRQEPTWESMMADVGADHD